VGRVRGMGCEKMGEVLGMGGGTGPHVTLCVERMGKGDGGWGYGGWGRY
jgi:hypothetical protein